jgi:uncharacterized protein with NRDE domain
MLIKRIYENYECDYGNAIEIELVYDIGGYNIITGEEDERGYYLNIVYTSLNYYKKKKMIPFDKFFTCIVKKVKRRTEKTSEKLVKELDKNLNRIVEAYINDDYDKIKEIVKNF